MYDVIWLDHFPMYIVCDLNVITSKHSVGNNVRKTHGKRKIKQYINILSNGVVRCNISDRTQLQGPWGYSISERAAMTHSIHTRHAANRMRSIERTRYLQTYRLFYINSLYFHIFQYFLAFYICLFLFVFECFVCDCVTTVFNITLGIFWCRLLFWTRLV